MIPQKTIEAFRKYTNADFRKFVKTIEFDLGSKFLVGGMPDDPDCKRLIQSAVIITVLTERVEKLEKKLNEKNLATPSANSDTIITKGTER